MQNGGLSYKKDDKERFLYCLVHPGMNLTVIVQ